MTRVAVVGVGAVGGVVAAGLMATGRLEVTACVRSPLGGLRIVRPDGSAGGGPVTFNLPA